MGAVDDAILANRSGGDEIIVWHRWKKKVEKISGNAPLNTGGVHSTILIQYERRGVQYGYNKNLHFAEPQDGNRTALVPENHIVSAMVICC
jgi:hypothetical protein